MAILENRYKAQSQIVARSILAVPEFVRRFLSVILFLLSLQILYFSHNYKSNISAIALENASYPIDFGLRIYDSITKPINNFTNFIYDFRDLRRQNLELKIELKKLQDISSYAEVMRVENNHLQKALNITSEIKQINIPARVLSIATSAYGMYAIIDSGSDSGIENGQTVINGFSIVGRIIEVSKSHAKMALISDFSSRIPVFGNESGVKAILAGSNDNNPSLLYVLDGAEVKYGELLISSGDGKNFPQGYKVARVKSISGSIITTTPEVSLSTLRYVNVLKGQE